MPGPNVDGRLFTNAEVEHLVYLARKWLNALRCQASKERTDRLYQDLEAYAVSLDDADNSTTTDAYYLPSSLANALFSIVHMACNSNHYYAKLMLHQFIAMAELDDSPKDYPTLDETEVGILDVLNKANPKVLSHRQIALQTEISLRSIPRRLDRLRELGFTNRKSQRSGEYITFDGRQLLNGLSG